MIKIKIWVDEAWRWPWLWPVVACAFCFLQKEKIDEDLIEKINDSKKITEKNRDKIFEKLIDLSLWKTKKLVFWVWVVDNFLIDKINIKQANKEAMRRALIELLRKIQLPHLNPLLKWEGVKIEVLIDWKDNYEFEELDLKPIFIVGWDGKVTEIWAASIIAKVFRDKLIKTYSCLYPDFSLEKHKWYWTKKHREYLDKKSKITWIHRISYKPIKKILEEKPKLLIHICCWPDATIPIVDLKNEYDITCFWYDPNIHPKSEYNKRLKHFKKVCKIEKIPFIEWEYDVWNFYKKIEWLEKEPEKWKRCIKCYDLRLEKTAKLAKKLWIKNWTTSLNISPHKSVEKLFEIWKKFDKKFDLKFLSIKFRKNNWFNRSVEYCKKHNIYRQNYCWCVFSKTFPK